jgi:hypothetical protein
MCKKYGLFKEKTITFKRFWLGMFAMMLIFGMAVISCDNGSTNESATYNNDAGPLAGTWKGTVMGTTATLYGNSDAPGSYTLTRV